MKKPSEKKFQKWSKDIMGNFDFDKVHKTMELLNWKWANIGVPSISEIKKNAKYVMNRAYESESGYCATGGFEAKIKKHGLSLKFTVTDWDAY